MSFTGKADEVLPVKKENITESEKKTLEQKSNLLKIEKLYKIYGNYGDTKDNIDFSKRFFTKEKYTYENVSNLSHPLLQSTLDSLTRLDVDAIEKSKEREEQKLQRFNTILNAGMKFGADAAFYQTSKDYYKKLKDEYYYILSDVFIFDKLTLDNGRVIPPVIDSVGYTEKKEDKRTKRRINKRYQVYKQAEIANGTPSFMDFFSMLNVETPKPPISFISPIVLQVTFCCSLF
jgi:hypothetical protein